MYFDSLNCKQNEPRSNCSLRSSLIRFHGVCSHGKKFSGVHLNMCNRSNIFNKQMIFYEEKIMTGLGLKNTIIHLFQMVYHS